MDIEHAKKEQHFGTIDKGVKDAYQAWHKAVFTEGVFDMKTMELMALSVSAVIRCKYCVESHSYKAKKAGATQEELAKAIQIAAVIGAGSTISYGIEGLDAPAKK